MSTTLPAWMRQAFSDPRLQPYLDATNGDVAAAERLYWWNVDVSAAFYGPLHILELGLRNALDSQLRVRFGRQAWWDLAPLAPKDQGRIREARDKCARERATFGADDVVARLSFGFWVSLLTTNYDRHLWVPALHKAFPNYRKARSDLYDKFDTMRLFRNRIMHHEPIHHRDLPADHRKIYLLMGHIDTAMAQHAGSIDKVQLLLSSRP